MPELSIPVPGATLAVQDDGSGPAVMLLHGLTATRRYVVMGSSSLERAGHRVIAYDARGHGRSSPAQAPDEYGYEHLAADAVALMDRLELDRAVLAGASMGAHTLLRVALDSPDRVAGLVVITPAFDPATYDEPSRLARWDALSDGLRTGGVEGFLAAYGEPRVTPSMRDTVLTVIRQRLSLHEHPEGVADALRSVPRSRPFGAIGELRAVDAPVAIVASGDDADPEHPEAIGVAYAAEIAGAQLITDEPGRSPIAWQGSQLSKVIASVVAQAR